MKKLIEKIAVDLEDIMKSGINIDRAFDLLEASTDDVREIIVVNALREIAVKDASALL